MGRKKSMSSNNKVFLSIDEVSRIIRDKSKDRIIIDGNCHDDQRSTIISRRISIVIKNEIDSGRIRLNLIFRNIEFIGVLDFAGLETNLELKFENCEFIADEDKRAKHCLNLQRSDLKSLEIYNCKFDRNINLDDITVRNFITIKNKEINELPLKIEIRFLRCQVYGEVSIKNLFLQSTRRCLYFTGAKQIEKINIDQCNIENSSIDISNANINEININRSKFNNSSLNAHHIYCKENIYIGYVEIKNGNINFYNSIIRGTIDLKDINLLNSDVLLGNTSIERKLAIKDCQTISTDKENQILINNSKISGDIYLNKINTESRINLSNTYCGGKVTIKKSKISKNNNEYSINANSLKINGRFIIDKCELKETVTLSHLETSDFLFRYVTISSESNVDFIGFGIASNYQIKIMNCTFNNAIVLDGSTAKLSVEVKHCKLSSKSGSNIIQHDRDIKKFDETALSLSEMATKKIDITQNQITSGNLDLSDSETIFFKDNSDIYKQLKKEGGHINIKGFRYNYLKNPSGLSQSNISGEKNNYYEINIANERIEWLNTQSKFYLYENFNPQPWKTLQRALLSQGYKEASDQIAIESNRQALRSGKFNFGRSLSSKLLDIFGNYGYSPWLTIKASLVSIILFSLFWAYIFSKCVDNSCTDENIFILSSKGEYEYTSQKIYPQFNPLIYTIDLFLPGINIGHSKNWSPNLTYDDELNIKIPYISKHDDNIKFNLRKVKINKISQTTRGILSMGKIIYVVYIFNILIGIILGAYAVIGFSGLFRHKD